MRIATIVFPTDFSDCAEGAFSHASHLAARHDAELHVLNVARPDIPPKNDPMESISAGTSRSEVDAAGDAAHEIVLVHSRIESASPATGILEYAGRHAADLIVMGTHGRKGLDHVLSGSVAEEVVRRASCPVFTVRCTGAAGWKDDVRKILVPIDFSDYSPLPTALEMARAYDADVYVLHVIEEAVLSTVYGVEPLSTGTPLYVSRAQQTMQKLLDKLGARDLDVHLQVRIGSPARRILEFAKEEGIDLIVLASHGRTGLSRLLLGSVAEKVVRHAHVPVFTCKTPRPTSNGSAAAA